MSSPVPHPRRPDVPPAVPAQGGVVVHRGLPGDRATWARRAVLIGELLVALADAESDGLGLPPSLAGRRALRAWSRSAERAVAAAGDAEAVVSVHTDDADVLAAAGRDLAAVLRHERDIRRRTGPRATPTGATADTTTGVTAGTTGTAGTADTTGDAGTADTADTVGRLCAILHATARRQDVAVEQLVAELGRAARILAPGHLRPRSVPALGTGAGTAPTPGAVAG
ncbi:hypothetical protein FVA95_14190 [Pseudonocardia sp. EV170527-09]|uniref:hypothetical protein n=1 Tax=Pseudonocardia sp. EV170527-09 TaxID=2603411 RepID=UPI0011F2B71D|nr:hypothetical protein [Pseudonocardia sp. EV170527-09]KAA1027748.1 hypothetical protein FVA95_14190 [Pseudonocardia sp. EV170527-09]